MRIVSILLVALLCSQLCADVVLLKDGTRVEGDVKRGDSGYDVTNADGKVTHVNSGEIQSIQLGKSSSAGSATDKLASLKRSVEAMDDLNKIVARYNDFIQQNKNTPAATQAQNDLGLWQDRLAKHMVKVAGKWVTPEEQEQLIAKSGDIIKQAYDLMKANKLKEAEPVVKQALDVDPTSPVANYLMGVLLFRSDKLVPARKSFETVHAQLPADAATLNNLAVIAWRQNQFINSLGFYAEAMLAMPANKEIINNVAEALAALKTDMRKNPAAQRASRLFVEQENQLETTMAQYGWYRWGSMWLDKNQLDELKKNEKEVKDKIDDLQKQFDDQQKKLRDNQDQMAKDQKLMDDLRMNSTYPDGKGGYIQIPQPQAYYDAGADINRLQKENDTISKNMDQLREAAKRLDATKPKPKFTGVQNIIGVEGTPKVGVLVADEAPAPASQPAAAPATQPTPAVEPANPPAPAPVLPPTTNRVF